MLSKAFRLKHKKDIEKALKEGRGFFSVFVILKALENGQNQTRVGFICSKKVSPKAVLRNKAKRQTTNIVEKYISQVRVGYDLVFICKREIIGADFEQIKMAVERLLKQSGICKKI